MAKGTLQVITTMADQAIAVGNAIVRVYKDLNNEIVFEDYLITDDEGKTEVLQLEAPARSLSLNENNRTRPYEIYSVEIMLAGYQTRLFRAFRFLPMNSAYCRFQWFQPTAQRLPATRWI